MEQREVPITKYLPSAYTSLAWVTFDLEQGPVTVESTPGNESIIPGSPFLYSVQTQKTLAQPEGKFQVTLAAAGDLFEDGKSWIARLRPNDRVEIRLSRRRLSQGSLPDEEETVMVGLIDRIQENRGVHPESGTPIMTAVVTGSDFSKLLRQAKVTHNTYLSQINEALLITQLADAQVELFDADQILSLFRFAARHHTLDLHFTSDNGQLRLFASPDGENHATLQPVFPISDARYLTHQGDFWSLLEQIANRPFCELYFDTIKGKPTLVFRRTPFGPVGPAPAWPSLRDLKRHVLTARHYWSTRTLQRSDADLVNVIQVYSQIMGMPLNTIPVKIDESLRLYGLRLLTPYVTIIPTKFTADLRRQAIASNGQDRPNLKEEDLKRQEREMDDYFSSLADVLADWFGHKSRFEKGENQPLHKSGVLPITFSPGMRIGQAAEFPDIEEIYYIEGVAHRIEVKKSAQTVLTLTRGERL